MNIDSLLAEWTGLEPATPGVTGRYSNQLNYHSAYKKSTVLMLAEWTGLEPATPGVTGRYSNQLNYHSSAIKTNLTILKLAEWTGLEPATPGVTGRYSNQLNYHSTFFNIIKQLRSRYGIHLVNRGADNTGSPKVSQPLFSAKYT